MSKKDRADARDADEFELSPSTELPVELPPPPAETAPVATVKLTARPGFLLVATNPYCASDQHGRPSGACPMDPTDPRFYDRAKSKGTVRGFVGATRIVGEVTREAPPNAAARLQTERRDIQWTFAREPFELPDTGFYRKKIQEGSLLDATQDYEAARAGARARSECAVEPRWT